MAARNSMHQAYSVQSIVKQQFHIESIVAFDNYVILANREQLVMYELQPKGRVDMVMFSKNVSKKPIVQMEVVATERLLFMLTDARIHVCDISSHSSNFARLHSSALTKDCNIFAVYMQTAKSTTGIVTNIIKGCCAIKRRLLIFYWKKDQLVLANQMFDLKDVPKALCLLNDIVCVGYKDEYVLYDISAKDPKYELLENSSLDPCICIIKNNMLAVSRDNYMVAFDPIEHINSKKKTQPAQGSFEAVSSVQEKNMLKTMMWSKPLLNLIWDEPYAIGLLSNNKVEVRCLQSNVLNKNTLVQDITELSEIKYLVRAAQGILFAAATTELWCIRSVPIEKQRYSLLQQNRFPLAIELTNISNESEEMKAQTIRQIRLQFATELFAKKHFAEAMSNFAMAPADPYNVVRLFPTLVQDQSRKTNTEDGGGVAVPVLPMPVLEDKDLENALEALTTYLSTARQKDNSKSLLSIIDTTLLKCYLQINREALIPSLIRLKNCHFEETEKTLKKNNKLAELIILYQTYGKHKKALELLQQQSNVEGSPLYGIQRTIFYLQKLGSTHLKLLFEFSDWVLQTNAEEGLHIFIGDPIEVESLPRAQVLNYLLEQHKALVIPYLEYVINTWKDDNKLLHNVLIGQYKEKILKLQAEIKELTQGATKSQLENDLRSYRAKLYDLLKNSQNYAPEMVLKDFPINSMLEERAIILGRLKEHKKVLTIYIKLLGNVERATQYCEENYEEDNDIFLKLMNTILIPIEDETSLEGLKVHADFVQPKEELIVQLLNKYAVKINPCHIWPHLPQNMPFYRLQHYLETFMRLQMAQKHEMQIKEGLLQAELRRTIKLIKEQQSKHFEINEQTICPDCKKRFDNQPAFVRYPNGQIVHLSCHDKRMQTTNNITTTTTTTSLAGSVGNNSSN